MTLGISIVVCCLRIGEIIVIAGPESVLPSFVEMVTGDPAASWWRSWRTT